MRFEWRGGRLQKAIPRLAVANSILPGLSIAQAPIKTRFKAANAPLGFNEAQNTPWLLNMISIPGPNRAPKHGCASSDL